MAGDTDRLSGVKASSLGHDLASPTWLDTHYQAMVPEYEDMLRWVGLEAGWHVLDAACGTGSYLPVMTELVGSRGRVSALDLAPENLRVVEEKAEHGGWPAPVEIREGNILDLPYADSSFDAVWCANTSQYLTDAELHTLLQEFRRVVRPGGLVAVKEVEGTSMQLQPTPPMLCIHLNEAQARAGSRQIHGILRSINMPEWMREVGLVEIRQRPTCIVRLQPVRAVEQQFIRSLLEHMCDKAEELDLPEEEAQVWRKLADVDADDHILKHPDFQYRVIQTVFVGRRN